MILADGQKVRDLVPESNRVRLIELANSSEIGRKRNFGCEHAAGDVIAHWDDDDYSAPDRLTRQIALLTQSGKAVTGYYSMRFTDGGRWWRYGNDRTFALGTSLCYRRDWWNENRFPCLQVGEDNRFVENAFAQGQLLSVDANDLMYATIHPGNTSPRTLGSNWKELPPQVETRGLLRGLYS